MPAKEGDKVSVDYEGSFDSGEIFDSSYHGEHSHPIEFIIGEHQVIAGFEEGVIGMNIGDEKKVSIEPEDAYGVHREELEREFPKSEIPFKEEPKEGAVLDLMTPDGRHFTVRVAKVTENTVVLNLNHPLAGKRLNFKIKLVEIKQE